MAVIDEIFEKKKTIKKCNSHLIRHVHVLRMTCLLVPAIITTIDIETIFIE